MENYMKLEMIGKGGGGNVVYRVRNLTNRRIYAMKRIMIDGNNIAQTNSDMQEIDIFKTLSHPNLIEYIESFKDKNKLCIIMEYGDDGDLSQKINEQSSKNVLLSEDIIWNWFIQLCYGLSYLHSKKIIHRDIKSQNVFINKQGVIKLGDFGISKVLINTLDLAKTSLGTPYFMSPEICSGKPYAFKSDMWMLGCVLFELATQMKPFEGNNLPILMINILNQELPRIPEFYSEEMIALIKALLNKDANLRPSITEVLQMPCVIKKIDQLNLHLHNIMNMNSSNISNSNSNSNSNNIMKSPKCTSGPLLVSHQQKSFDCSSASEESTELQSKKSIPSNYDIKISSIDQEETMKTNNIHIMKTIDTSMSFFLNQSPLHKPNQHQQQQQQKQMINRKSCDAKKIRNKIKAYEYESMENNVNNNDFNVISLNPMEKNIDNAKRNKSTSTLNVKPNQCGPLETGVIDEQYPKTTYTANYGTYKLTINNESSPRIFADPLVLRGVRKSLKTKTKEIMITQEESSPELNAKYKK